MRGGTGIRRTGTNGLRGAPVRHRFIGRGGENSLEAASMKRRLLDILACPICKHYPLGLEIFKEGEEIEEGMLTCENCGRWYPIMETIPHMLPDELRDAKEERGFLERWKDHVPEKILRAGKPFNMGPT